MSTVDLIRQCEKAINACPSSEWKEILTFHKQERLARCWLLLTTGCHFDIVSIKDDFIHVVFQHPLFPEIIVDGEKIRSHYYIPTDSLLASLKGNAWY